MTDNAKNADMTVRSYMCVGYPGSGKTSLFATIPGKKFMYVFDPNTLKTLRGLDIDYKEFVPDLLPMDIISLSKSTAEKQVPVMRGEKPVVWEEFSADFEERFNSGFFDQYDVIGFDGMTMMQSAGMQQIAFVNNRYGKWPQEDDYAPVIQTFENTFVNISSLGKSIFLAVHLEERDDYKRKTTFVRPVLLGRLRSRLPMSFSEIFLCSCQSSEGGGGEVDEKFEVQTRPDDMYKTVRCTIKGLDFYEDVTIQDWANPEDYGIGALLDKERKNTKPKPKSKSK